MASRRSLKKNSQLYYRTGSRTLPGRISKRKCRKTGSLQRSIPADYQLRNDIISRISHTEPGSVKLFYKKLRADFNAEVDNVFKKLEELSK